MPGPCQRLQDEVDNIDQEIQDLLDALPDVPPRARPAILRQVAKLRLQRRPLNNQLQACLHDPTPYLLQLDGIEVCQSVQGLGNPVPLIAGKKSIVRAYLSYYGAAPITVTATLQAQASGTPAVSVPSLAPVVLDPARAGDTVAKRQNVALSLNFLLPDAQTVAGPLTVTIGSVTNTTTHAMMSVAFNSATMLQFSANHPLRVRVLAVRYRQQVNPLPAPMTTFLATASDLQHLQSWLRRAYPVANVIWSTGVIDATAAVPFSSGDINAQLAAIRALDVSAGTDKRTHYYGMVADGGFFMRGSAAGIPATPDPSVVAAGPTGPANWGWDFDGSYGDWYGGHELGHTFGRMHPGFCRGNSRDDTAYPYPNGQLANSDASFNGFDVGDPALGLAMASLPGTLWFDVMTYCNNEWLSDYTYEAIQTRLAAEDALPAGAVPGAVPVPQLVVGGAPDDRFPEATSGMSGQALLERNLVNVVASINLTSGQGKFEFVQPVPGAEPSALDPNSQVIVRARRADGSVLRDYPVPVKLNSELGPADERIGLIDPVLPLDADARALDLIIHGRTVDTFRAGAQPPSLTSASVVGGADGEIAVAWETGPREPTHTYAVQASTDGGQTWQTLAVGLTDPTVRIDRTQFGAGQTVKIRVIATDGFTRSEVMTEEFQT
jgi:hypothetical protein